MDPRDETPVRAGRGAYGAVAASFLIHSTVSGTWAPRLPAIKESLDLSDGELGTALVGLGVASGALDVAMNAQGIEVERRLGRPILSGLHGLWSVGLGIGAGVAAVAAAIDAGPLEHFAVVAAVLAVASLVFLRGLLPADRLS